MVSINRRSGSVICSASTWAFRRIHHSVYLFLWSSLLHPPWLQLIHTLKFSIPEVGLFKIQILGVTLVTTNTIRQGNLILAQNPHLHHHWYRGRFVWRWRSDNDGRGRVLGAFSIMIYQVSLHNRSRTFSILSHSHAHFWMIHWDPRN
jgi:hypothetical protein